MQSHHVTPQTRAALEERITHKIVTLPRCFNEEQFRTLAAVCARLIPQPIGEEPVDLPGVLDKRLQQGDGKGWRYDVLPSDTEMFRSGMDNVALVAQALCGDAFRRLNGSQQDEVLRIIQAGEVSEALWQRIQAQRFFEELLAALCGIYYSHPAAKADIGDISFADVPGWTAIRLNGHDSREPSEISLH